MNISYSSQSLYLGWLICLSFLNTSLCSAQVDWLWVQKSTYITGAPSAAMNGVATDNFGNIYGVGYINLSHKFGEITLTSQSVNDAVLVRYDKNGKVKWAVNFVGDNNNITTGYDVSTDSKGAIYITGYAQGENAQVGYSRIFLAKYDSLGILQWTKKSLGGTIANAYRYTIKTDSQDNVYIAGVFLGTIHFDNVTLTTPNFDYFITKYDSNGNLVWAKQLNLNSSSTLQYNILSTDHNNNVYYYYVYNSNIYLIKIDANGNLLWTKQTTNSSGQYGIIASDICNDSQGNVYITGTTNRDTYYFDNIALTASGGYQGYNASFISKYDPSGNVVWVKGFANTERTGNAIPYRMTIDKDDNIYQSGYFGGTVDIGSIILDVPYGTGYPYVAKYNQSGKAVWAKIASNADRAGHNDIALDSDNNLYYAGQFYCENGCIATFGNISVDVIRHEAYIAKLGCTNILPSVQVAGNPALCGVGASVTLTANLSAAYLWSTGETTQSIVVTEPGSYTVQTTQDGCVSPVSTPIKITHTDRPPAPIIQASADAVCEGGTIVLQATGGDKYLWSNGETTAEITVKKSGVYTVQAVVGDCYSEPSPAKTLIFEAYPLNVEATLAQTNLAVGGNTRVVIRKSEASVKYKLYRKSDNQVIGTEVAGNGGDLNLPTGVILVDTEYGVIAQNFNQLVNCFINLNATLKVSVFKTNQSISFSAFATKTYGDAPFDLGASASSGLPITYLSANESVATISNNTITIVGAGSSVITAKQSGNDYYNPASDVPRTLTVNKANQVITFGALSPRTVGDAPFNLEAIGGNSGNPIVFTSSNPNVATISGNTLTIVGAGLVSITAKQAGNNNYQSASDVSQVLSVSKANQSISFGSLPNKTFGDPAFSLSATSTSGLPITYSSSNPNVVSIQNNTASIVGTGTVSITAKQAGNNGYNAASDVSQSLTVNKANQSITFGALSSKTFGDAPFALNASINSSLVITYSSSDQNIATISDNLLTIKGAGTVSITAKQAGNNNYNAASDISQSLLVNKANQTITFNAISDKFYNDPPIVLNATASSNLPIIYKVSTNPLSGVSNLSGNTLSLVGLGDVSITASQEGNNNFNAANALTRNFKVLLPTALEADVLSQNTQIFPNPTGGKLKILIHAPNFDQIKLGVWDLLGKKLAEQSLKAQNDKIELDLDLSHFANGLYILQLENPKGQKLNKIIFKQ